MPLQLTDPQHEAAAFDTALIYAKQYIEIDVSNLNPDKIIDPENKVVLAYISDPKNGDLKEDLRYLYCVFATAVNHLIDTKKHGVSPFELAIDSIKEKAHLINQKGYTTYSNTIYPLIMVLEYFDRIKTHKLKGHISHFNHTPLMLQHFMVAYHYLDELVTLHPE